MNRLSGLAAAAALVLSGAGAQAATLYDGYRTAGGAGGIDYIDPSTLVDKGKFVPLADQPIGLAVGGGGTFTSFADHTIARRNLSGGLSVSTFTGPAFTPGLLAFGANTLFVGFTNAANATGVDFLDATTLADTGKSFFVPNALSGLAFGDNDVFVSYSHYIAEYDLTGALMQVVNTGPSFIPEALAFGDGKLFVGFKNKDSGATGIDFMDGASLIELGKVIYTPTLALGLAYGGGELFGSFDHSLKGWDLTGAEVSTINTGPYYFSGQIAYGPDAPGGRGVPEPATWALMILGFGAAGLRLRRTRAALA